MPRCSFCGETPDGLPFTCNECGKTHCGAHRLPERHRCQQLGRIADRPTGAGTFIGNPGDRHDRTRRFDGGYTSFTSVLDRLLLPLRRLRRRVE
ncbi:AN1-type zinc finger domain-containing protein [Haloarchaeobius sp. TZWWS8]|uniref:AN1-type zinc finger domain-containing protein n=1 Tax=Haloarchaeobius sp. TZWWS8 TaxID=3446121 RepID=UPI003EC0A50D